MNGFRANAFEYIREFSPIMQRDYAVHNRERERFSAKIGHSTLDGMSSQARLGEKYFKCVRPVNGFAALDIRPRRRYVVDKAALLTPCRLARFAPFCSSS